MAQEEEENEEYIGPGMPERDALLFVEIPLRLGFLPARSEWLDETRPRPHRFPFARPPEVRWLPPWAPRGWYVPPAATNRTYCIRHLRSNEGESWALPSGTLHVYFEGPPGLSEVLRVELRWGGRFPGWQGAQKKLLGRGCRGGVVVGGFIFLWYRRARERRRALGGADMVMRECVPRRRLRWVVYPRLAHTCYYFCS